MSAILNLSIIFVLEDYIDSKKVIKDALAVNGIYGAINMSTVTVQATVWYWRSC